MGWAVALHRLGIEYDSEDACMEASKMMQFIRSQSYLESELLGFEREYFPACRRKEKRNACTNTIAPTGALSLLAGTSSSIEPVFSRQYTKTLHDGDKMSFSFDGNIPVATEIAPEWHVRMQAAFQRHVDNAVSKTINLPNESSIEDVKKALILAYEMQCKGITLYRQGTRDAPLKSDEDIKECSSGRCKI
jgi:ribonucleoside-diphosphate reductase alpha chain